MRGLSVGRLFKRLRGLRKETVCVTGQKQGGPTRRVPPRASRCHRRARRWPLATMFLWYAIAALGPLRSPKEQGGNLPRRRAAVTPKAPKRSGGVAQRLDGGSAAWPPKIRVFPRHRRLRLSSRSTKPHAFDAVWTFKRAFAVQDRPDCLEKSRRNAPLVAFFWKTACSGITLGL